MDLVEQVKTALHRAAETAGADFFHEPLIIGVSGGPDSLALLHLLRSVLAPENLIVAHLDHGLRPESAQDAAFVAAAAGDLRFHTERADVTGMSRAERLSIEEAGRMARYNFLARLAREEGAAAVVVGHNADDQAETVLMHFLRGSGLSGLSGMRPASPLAGHPGLWIVRPLLQVTRAKIDAYCAEHDLRPLIDASNSDQTFFRNRLRHDLLPLLETYNPQIRQRLRDSAEVIAADEDLLSDFTETAWRDIATEAGDSRVEIERSAWLDLPLALRRRTLRWAIGAVRPALRDVGFGALESARLVAERAETGSMATLPGGVTLRVSYGKLLVGLASPQPDRRLPQLLSDAPVPLPIPGEMELAGGWRITAEWVDEVDLQAVEANRDPWTAMIEAGSAALIVRSRLSGERMRPLGLGGETKIKEIMIDRKIPAEAREGWPIVATDTHAVWIVGHVVDDRAQVRPESGRIVRLRCVRETDSEAG